MKVINTPIFFLAKVSLHAIIYLVSFYDGCWLFMPVGLSDAYTTDKEPSQNLMWG